MRAYGKYLDAMDGGEWSASRHCRFTPEEGIPWYTSNRRLSEPHSRSGPSGHGGETKIPTPPKQEISVKKAASRAYACYVFRAGFLLDLLFNPEEGGDMFLRKVG
jgi:hypothetical protein